MNVNINAFLDKVCDELEYKNARKYIKEEFESHILDSIDYHKAKGLDETNSINEALNNIGNPIEIGKMLNKIHRPKHEISVLIAFVLLIIGGFTVGRKIGTAELYYMFSVASMAIAILLIFLAGYHLDYKKIQKHGNLLCIIGLICIATYCLIKTANRTSFGSIPLNFYYNQAFTLSIPFLIIAYIKILIANISEFKSILTFTMISLIVVILLPKLGIINSILITGTTLTVTASILYEKYKLNRSKKYIYLFSTSILSLIFIVYVCKNLGLYNTLINHNEIFDTELNLRCEYIIQFIFINLGKLSTFVIIGISIFMVIRIFTVAHRISDLFGKLFVVATASILFLEIVLNLLVGFEIVPYINGVYLPFISYGKTNYLVNLLLVSLSLGIYRRKDIIFTSSTTNII